MSRICATRAGRRALKVSVNHRRIVSSAIERGQAVWMNAGGQELGSLWGHGSYVAPDWSADWLHREAVGLREQWAHNEFGKPYAELDSDR